MKRLLLLILLALCSIIQAGQNEYSMIDATEFGRDYLEGYGVVSALNLKGVGHSYAIAKDTGAIVIFSSSDEKLKFHYLDINGTTIWTKSFLPIAQAGNQRNLLDISDDGSRVLMQQYFRDTNQYSIYNGNREILLTNDVKKVTYDLSSDGRFLLPEASGLWGDQNETVIYDIYGGKRELPMRGNYDIRTLSQCFISPDKLISQLVLDSGKKHLVCFEISGGEIKQLWDKESDYRYMSSGIYQQLKSYNNWIGLGANTDDLRIIDINAGELLKEYKGRNGSWGISQKGNILLNGRENLEYLAWSKGENQPVEVISEAILYNAIQDFIELEDGMIINLNRDFWSPQKYASLYYSEGEFYYLQSQYNFVHCNNKDYIIAINLISDPEVIIYVKNESVEY